MNPRALSIRERLLASNLWGFLWFAVVLVLALWWVFEATGFSAFTLTSFASVVLLVVTVSASVVLAVLASTLLGFAIFDDVLQWQARKNGAPFSVGDRVVIIPGRKSGREATVTSFGQCKSLRITIDGEQEETAGYSAHQLKRVVDPRFDASQCHGEVK